MDQEAIRQLKIQFVGLEDFPLFLRTTTATAAPQPMVAASFCTDCGRHRTRRNMVKGQIIAGAKFLFVGAAPLDPEDKSAEPFQGARGELLQKMLGAMQLSRGQVSLLHIVQCFSPQSIEASVAEIEACQTHLLPQMQAAQARCIVAMGQAAAQAITRTNSPLSQLRGKTWDWNGAAVVVTHDPATLLERADLKKEAWADLQYAMKL